MVVAIGGGRQPARSAATAWLAEVVPGDELLTSIRPIASTTGIAEILAAVAASHRVSPIATFSVAAATGSTPRPCVGADLLADERLAFVAGDRRGRR